MNAMDPIPRRDFLRLIGRTEHALNSIRKRREIMLWRDPPAPSKQLTETIAYDAALFLVAASIVGQGAKWEGVRLALPGLQYALRDGIDRPDAFAAITVVSNAEILVGCGSIDELARDGVIGLGSHSQIAPIAPVADLLRQRAAEHGVKVPKRIAPPLVEMPTWAKGDLRWQCPIFGARVAWQPAGSFALAMLN